jgi:hypothetical protein
MCTRFLESGEYCEKCGAVAEADAYMKSRDRNREARIDEITKTTQVRVEKEEGKQKSENKDRIYIQGGAVLGSLMVFVSLGLYAFPDLLKSDQELAEQQSVMNLEACRQVFESIGIMLSEGNVPETTMGCPGTNIPNIIRRNGNTVTVSHPDPRQFGLVELYVTNDSHRVIME